LAFGLLDGGDGGVALGAALVELGLARHLALLQRQLAVEICFRLHQQRLLLPLRGLRDLQARLIGRALDLEQGRAGCHPVAVLVADLLEKPLHARHEVDLVEGRRVARQLEVQGDAALLRLLDADLRRRRWLIFVGVVTAGQHDA
jgi:hypothetical protein